LANVFDIIAIERLNSLLYMTSSG